MARRKPVAAAAPPSIGRGAPAPLEILRCPWTTWDSPNRSSTRFERWLRDRQEWRETHDAPLPGLFGRDRLEFHNHRDAGQLDPAVVRTEETAPNLLPEWVRKAQAAGTYPRLHHEGDHRMTSPTARSAPLQAAL